MANTAIIRDAYGAPAIFVGPKTRRDDAPFVFVRVGNEERRMRRSEWDALPAWIGARPSRAGNRNSYGMLSITIAGIAMRVKGLLLIAALGAFLPTSLAAEPNCRVIESTGQRLACYDAAFPPPKSKKTEAKSMRRQANTKTLLSLKRPERPRS
jgi:hypothetical protein